MPSFNLQTNSDIPQKWARFFDQRGAQKSFYLGLPWFQNLAKNALEAGSEPVILAAENDAGEPVAALLSRRPNHHEDFTLSKLLPGPRCLASLTSYQTTMFALLTSGDKQADRQAIDEIAAQLAGPETSATELKYLRPDDPATRQLADALRARGQIVRTFDHDFMIFENVAGTTFDDYWKSRPSRLKNTHRRREKQLAKKGEIRFEMIQDPADVDRGLEYYDEVFGVSWKDPEEFPGFTPGLVKAAAESGALRLGVLFLDDRPISAQIWLVSGGVASILKLHYVDDFKDYSPGTICSHHMMRHVIDTDHVDEIDFGSGTSTYKKWWMNDERRLRTVLAFNPKTLRGLISFTLFSFLRTGQALREGVAAGIVRPWRRWERRPRLRLRPQNAIA